MTLVVRGGTVVTTGATRTADVVADDDGRCVAVLPPGTADIVGATVLDAGNLMVLPGGVDAHVHFQEPGRETWEGFATGSAAAVSGGVTTVVDMPIDCDPPTITAERVEAKAAAARRHSIVDVAMWGGLVPASVPELERMLDAGVVGFKAFACPSGWDAFPPVDEATLTAGFAVAARADVPVAVHCELAELGHGPDSEVAAVRWSAALAQTAGARMHVVHVSAAEAVVEARRWAGVTIETCPHYLTLDDRDVGRRGPVAHCSPPIRDADNRRALWAHVLAGDVHSIASDHSPCPPEAKVGPDPWAGIDGAGMTLPLLLTSGRLSWPEIAELTTAAARLLRLDGKGEIRAGYDADLAVVDPDEEWIVHPNDVRSRHGQSPYIGMRMTGRVVATVRRGQVVFSCERGVDGAGGGRVFTGRSADRRRPGGCRRWC
ncbi:MAG: amidohydrolase family protein [Acidimicrobiales bacterium]